MNYDPNTQLPYVMLGMMRYYNGMNDAPLYNLTKCF